MMKNKKAAMEMTMGTVVTIVLLIAVLVMVLYFISNITDVGTKAISGIDQEVMKEINNLFSDDNDAEAVFVPSSRIFKIKKGDDSLGFGISIRNKGGERADFSYVVSARSTDCDMRLPEAEDLIALGKQDSDISIPAGSIMKTPIFVRFDIPEEAPPCLIRYAINLKRNNIDYGSTDYMDLDIVSA